MRTSVAWGEDTPKSPEKTRKKFSLLQNLSM
jgi:hypothetical protein